jgi:hypothetical protein
MESGGKSFGIVALSTGFVLSSFQVLARQTGILAISLFFPATCGLN